MFKIRSLAALGLLAYSAAAGATTVIPLTPHEVEERASTVIVATITETVVWTETNGTIRTDLVLEDVRAVGTSPWAPDTLTFTGGELDGRGMIVHGMPEFPEDVPLLLFIEGDGQSEACPVVGWDQGIYVADGPDRFVTLDGARIAVLGAAGPSFSVGTLAAPASSSSMTSATKEL